jgi:hypothetical protein
MCAYKCGLHPDECNFWIYSEPTKYCVMKSSAYARVRLDGHVSGPRKCCENYKGD